MQPDVVKADIPTELLDSTGRFVAQAFRIAEHLPPQGAERVNQAPSVQGVDPQLSARLEEPSELSHGRSARLERLRHSKAKDTVELLRPERKAPNISDGENSAVQSPGDGLSKRRQRVIGADNLMS